MAKAPPYDALLYQLGDLARDRLAGKAQCPRCMEDVYAAEEQLVARQAELQALEDQLNAEEQALQDRLGQQAEEKASLLPVIKKWKKAVEGVEGEVRSLRKKLAGLRSDVLYSREALKKIDLRHQELELSSKDAAKIDQSRQGLKLNRLRHMRLVREVEEVERAIQEALTCDPDRPGAAGILAHKRLLELEDEAEAAQQHFQDQQGVLDEALGAKEEEIREAEAVLDQALLVLGEEVYRLRLADASLSPFYPRLDRAAPAR